MKKITRKKHLEMKIQSIPPHPKPKVELEQYSTPSNIASDLLWNALSLGDIKNKNVYSICLRSMITRTRIVALNSKYRKAE